LVWFKKKFKSVSYRLKLLDCPKTFPQEMFRHGVIIFPTDSERFLVMPFPLIQKSLLAAIF